MSEGNSHFLMAIGRIDGGLLIENADQQLREVISAVHRTGKKGTVSVTIEVSPNGETGLEVTAKLAAKAPQVSYGKSFFFMGRDGDLTRNAPSFTKQGAMFKPEGNANV